MTSMKDDLLYRGIRHRFFALTKEGKRGKKKCILIATDLMKIIDCASNKSMIGLNQRLLIELIQQIIEKLDKVRGDFWKMVVESACSRETGRSIGQALQPIMERMIPTKLVGGRKNKKALIKNIMKMFLYGKDDIISEKILMDGVDVKKVVYTKRLPGTSVKEVILLAVVKWLCGLTKRIVAYNFYVSERQESQNQLTYIPKLLWQSETDQAFAALKQSLKHLAPPEAEQMALMTPPAKLRWVPKSVGLRPILSSRCKGSVESLRAHSLVMDLVKKRHQPANWNYLHATWKQLIQTHRQGKNLYFVVCDIHNAFGSINQDKMVEIVEEEVMRQRGAMGFRDVEDDLCYIKNSIKCQTLKKLKKTYLLTKGLGQGMCLSAQLCNLYLSHMDRYCLSSFTVAAEDRLFRTADDYLYVTPDKAKAQQFLDKMEGGIVEYNIKAKPSKTQTNLTGDCEILYCGYLINTKNLEVYVRYRAGITASFRNSMVINKDPILMLDEKIVHSHMTKLNAFTLDRAYMTVEGVTRNVFNTGCLLARQFAALLSLSRPCDIPDSGLLVELITRAACAVSNKVHSVWAHHRQMRDSSAQNEQAFKIVRTEDVMWVFLKAFAMVLQDAATRLPDDLALLVMGCSDAASTLVRPKIRQLMTPIMDKVPLQYQSHQV